MDTKRIALLAAFFVALIYGVSYTVAKDVMPNHIKPFGFLALRVAGATTIFWFIGMFMKSQKIEKEDYPRIILAAVFGVGINMLSFYKGLSITTPINASVLMLSTPIVVLVLSTFILKEKVTTLKLFGILIGLVGAVFLIVYGQGISTGSSTFYGDLLIFVNASSYGVYLVLVKKLTPKYSSILLIKWLYLFGLFFIVPFGINQLTQVQWEALPQKVVLSIIFNIVFPTVNTYLFNLFALKKLKPTTLSSFIYLQPLIATTYALIMGSDRLDPTKIIAALLIFTGVYLVTKSNSVPVKSNT